MQRTPEPRELMDEREQALAYAAANFSEANNLFIHLLHQLQPAGPRGPMLDLGCGPADIPIDLLREFSTLHIDALDGAQAMLDLAQARRDADPRLGERLQLRCSYLPSAELPQGHYHSVISNSLLHHLADPNDLWQTIRHCAQADATILIMDLARPSSPLAVDTLVETYAMNEPEVLREDFRNSLHAAYTVDEVRAQLAANGLDEVEVGMVSDRHWAARGSFNPGR